MSHVAEKHKAHVPSSLNLAVLTCSTSRYFERKQGKQIIDDSGDAIQNLAESAGHKIIERHLLPDDKRTVSQAVRRALRDKRIDAMVITGGTGLSPRDVTIEAVESLLDKQLPGFGELFRKISYDAMGSAAMMSRAMAGVAKGKAVFCLPGSPDAVKLALTRLIIPEAGHIIKIARQK